MSLVENIRNNVPTLTSLNFDNRWMPEEVLEPIVDALTTNTTVRTLSLVNSGIDARILEALALNSSLLHLNLSMNELRDVGMPSIAHFLEYNTSLQVLDLSVNGITDLGADSLARALVVNSTLTDLDLGLNKIKSPGTARLAQALYVNPAMRYSYAIS